MAAVAFRNRAKRNTETAGSEPGPVDDDGGEPAGSEPGPVDDDGGEPAGSEPGPVDDDGGEPAGSEPGPVDDDGGEWLAYELHAWASESRNMLAQLLLADGVVHSWQGTTLLAHESVEEEVDALIEEVELAERRELDSDEPLVAFEMEGWSGELQALLAERLGTAGVPHEFDADGDLVCHEADEEQVELVIEDLLARAEEAGLEALDGLEANDLLSAVFEATDRLRRDVRDPKGVIGVIEHGRRLAATATPFGFSATAWGSLRDAASELADLIESEEATDDEVTDLSVRLRDTLQRLI